MHVLSDSERSGLFASFWLAAQYMFVLLLVGPVAYRGQNAVGHLGETHPLSSPRPWHVQSRTLLFSAMAPAGLTTRAHLTLALLMLLLTAAMGVLVCVRSAVMTQVDGAACPIAVWCQPYDALRSKRTPCWEESSPATLPTCILRTHAHVRKNIYVRNLSIRQP